MYRDDEVARGERANALIDEIADLERQKLAQAGIEQRLEAARRQLRELQPVAAAAPARPNVATHLIVFAVSAAAAYLGYGLLF